MLVTLVFKEKQVSYSQWGWGKTVLVYNCRFPRLNHSRKLRVKGTRVSNRGHYFIIRKDCFQVKSNLLTVDNLVFHF